MHPVKRYLMEVGERYQALPKEPLRVTAELGDAVITYHGVHLDALLAYVVMGEAMRTNWIRWSPNYVTIPLPLDDVWRSETGVPLWASTDLLPEGEAVKDVMYLHRRAIEPTMSTRNIRTTAGRHKEKRTPMPVLVNKRLSAVCIGNGEEIARLLSSVSAIGKKNTVAGTVLRWLIEPITEFSFWDPDGRALRPVPLDYLGLAQFETPSAVEVGYSPPYWYAETRAWCVPTGSTP